MPDDPLDKFIGWAMFTINMSQPGPKHLAPNDEVPHVPHTWTRHRFGGPVVCRHCRVRQDFAAANESCALAAQP